MNNQFTLPISLLRPKLSPPRLPMTLVERARLLAILDRALTVPLTLLSASAGSGKTTLLRAWMAHESRQVAWLSLDELDNDPTRFWVVFIAALRTCWPEIGQSALTMLRSSPPPALTTILSALLEDMLEPEMPERSGADAGDGNRQVFLVIDDYHTISEPGIHEGMVFLLEHLPASVHLLLATRVNPPFPLARWRLHGLVEEVRVTDLHFTRTETERFLLESMHLSLSEEDVNRLAARTEGWIAGLQLAALALRQQENPSEFVQQLSGSHRLLLDYIQEEILARQPARIRRFLSQVSVLARMNASLCYAVTGEERSQEILEGLETNNLFVVPLDEQQQWYRLHDLFRSALLARVQVSEPGLVSELQRRAARWYESQGALQEAIPYALAARDDTLAAALIERAAEDLWLNGKAGSVSTWIMGLSEPVFGQHALLALDAALCLQEMGYQSAEPLRTRLQLQVEEIILRVETVLRGLDAPATPEEEHLSPHEQRVLQRRIRLLRGGKTAFDATTRGDWEALRRLDQEIQELATDEEDVSWRMIPLSLAFWMSESLQREGAALVPLLLEAKQQASRASNRLVLIRIMRWLTHVYARSGQLYQAQSECVATLDLIEQVGGQTAQTGYLYYYLACIFYAWNRLDEALTAMKKMRNFARNWQQVDQMIVGQTYSAWLSIVAGNLAEVPAMLAEAEELVQQRQFTLHRFRVQVVRVWHWLKVGDLAAASNWAERRAELAESWKPGQKEEFFTLIRVYLALRQSKRALAALERFRAELDRPGDVSSRIEFLALLAAAYQQAGETDRAREVAACALSISSPGDYVRVYVDVGQPLREVLQSLAANPSDPMIALPYLRKLLTAFEEKQAEAASVEAPGRGAGAAPAMSRQGTGRSLASLLPLGEALTRREEEVLKLLAQGASNQEIARQLVVSLATVKKHVANILSKLGVENRTQAVVRAREYALL